MCAPAKFLTAARTPSHRLRLCTTIREMSKVPWAPEGWLFLIPVLILTAAALLIQWTIAAIVLGPLPIFLINFFRVPRRPRPSHHVDVLSPPSPPTVHTITTPHI